MTTEIKFTNNSFITIMELLKDLVDDIIISFDMTNASFNMLSIDKTTTSLLQCSFRDCFDIVTQEEEFVEIGVNIVQLLTILKCKEKTESYSIKFSSEECVEFVFEDGTTDYSKYTLRLLDLAHDYLELPAFNENVSISMDSSHLTSLCKKMTNFGQSIIFETTGGGSDLFIKSITDDTATSVAELKITSKPNVTIDVLGDDIKSVFVLTLMNIYAKAEKFSNTVYLKTEGNDTPMEVIYLFDNNFIKFVIPPQIE